jgi:hypothetical protein
VYTPPYGIAEPSPPSAQRRLQPVENPFFYRHLLVNTSSTCMAAAGRTEGEVVMYMACSVGQRATKGCPSSTGDGALDAEVSPYWQSSWRYSGR